MNHTRLNTHHKRLLQQKSRITFEVVETCTFTNSYLIDTDKVKLDQDLQKNINYTAFIPAAGAASRYMKPLSTIKDQKSFSKFLDEHRDCAIPVDLDNFKSSTLKNIQSRPKALFPVVQEGPNFLNFKQLEPVSYTHLTLPTICSV